MSIEADLRARFEEDVAHRLATRLIPLERLGADVGHSDWNNPGMAPDRPDVMKPAAVLAPIVLRPDGWTLLLTRRTDDMPTHPGQTAFPGGRVQAEDENAIATALRETEEEIGLLRSFVRPIGGIGDYETGTGYRITPVIAYVDPGFTLAVDPREVAHVFETPLSFVLDPLNHVPREGEWRGHKRVFYDMEHNGQRIWGATAGMIRKIYEQLYAVD